MSTFVIGLFLSIGGAAWIFNKLQRSSGGANTQQSLLFAGIAGVLLLILTFIIFSFIPN